MTISKHVKILLQKAIYQDISDELQESEMKSDRIFIRHYI